MTRKLSAIILLAASSAIAAPIKINTGTDLTARTWPDGTELQVPKDAVLLVDKPVKWKGKLSIYGAGSWIRNRQAAPAATFSAADGQRLYIANATLAQSVQFTSKGWNSNRGIFINGSADVELRNVFINDGWGVECWQCNSFTWVGGGTGSVNTYQYVGYFGNNLANRFASNVYLEGLTARTGRKETAFRFMGASAQVINCTFAVGKDGHPTKESVQARHGDIYFGNCSFVSGQGGTLAPNIDGGKHTAYALKHPTKIKIEGGSMLGYWEVAGNTLFTTKSFRVLGGDPRGTGGQQPFNLLNYGKGLKPTGISIDTDVSGFKRFAAPGWQLVGCTLEGKAVK